jgi:hypothetical protein
MADIETNIHQSLADKIAKQVEGLTIQDGVITLKDGPSLQDTSYLGQETRSITISGQTLYCGIDIIESLLRIDRKRASDRVSHLLKVDIHCLEHINVMCRDRSGAARSTTFVTQALIDFMILRIREAGIPGTLANKHAMTLVRRTASENNNPSQLQLTSDPANAEIESLRQQNKSLMMKNQSLMMKSAEWLQQQIHENKRQ